MLSKDQRFKQHRVVYTGPGPGQYKPAALPEKLDFNRAKATSAFQLKVRTRSPLTLNVGVLQLLLQSVRASEYPKSNTSSVHCVC